MTVTVNGEEIVTHHGGVLALRQDLYPRAGEMVIVVDGYQVAEDMPLTEGAEIQLIPKGILPPEEQLEQMMMARLTPGVYRRVKAARVAVAGLGGLGSHIAMSLARTGVGHLHLVDFDMVEPSNLNRQQYGIRHLGMSKADALRQQIAEVNPFVQVRAEVARVTAENIPALFAEDSIICEAFDRPDQKAMLVETALAEFDDKVVVAASGMAGCDSGNEIRTRRAGERLYLCGDGAAGAQPGRGLMAPRVSICAGHQANMVLRLILGEEDA